MRLRIGIANSTKELDLNVDDAEAVVAAFEEALSAGERLLPIEQLDGAKTLVTVGSILYFDMEPPEKPGIGFAPAEASEG